MKKRATKARVSRVDRPPRLNRRQFCGYIGNYDIHAIDAAIWVLGQRPVAAMGASQAGAVRNIANFYRNVTEGRFENDTASRAVDGPLAAILGREAAARRQRLTLEALLQENQRCEVDLSGLKT